MWLFLFQAQDKIKLLCGKEGKTVSETSSLSDRGNQESWEVLTLCQGLDGQTLPGEEHHVLEGPPICFVCQVVSLDLREGDEALGHPHKLHIHLAWEGQHRSRLNKDTACR